MESRDESLYLASLLKALGGADTMSYEVISATIASYFE